MNIQIKEIYLQSWWQKFIFPHSSVTILLHISLKDNECLASEPSRIDHLKLALKSADWGLQLILAWIWPKTGNELSRLVAHLFSQASQASLHPKLLEKIEEAEGMFAWTHFDLIIWKKCCSYKEGCQTKSKWTISPKRNNWLKCSSCHTAKLTGAFQDFNCC